MTQTIRAIFENGVLRPLDPVDHKELDEVQVFIAEPDVAHTAKSMSNFPVFAPPEGARPITLETVQRACEDLP